MKSEHSHRVAVLADPAVALGECTLVHKNGRTELGLLAQFRAMMSGLEGGHSDTERQQ
jgi:flagellar biosynthesis/type III secretory pathway protein FliH